MKDTPVLDGINNANTKENGKFRLLQVDGLRAIAALSVVLFHYTSRFDELFLHVQPLDLEAPYGYLGVNLFFAISGFVIFMTIDRTQAPQDFVVSRFSRLFPAYWVAVVITWTLVTSLGLPGYEISWKEALVNLSMLQSFFSIRDVDGVYWSLQVELLFYIWMLLLWSIGLLRHPLRVCFAWVLLSLGSTIYANLSGAAFSYTLNRFLLLDWIPWFVMGMVIYASLRDKRFSLPHGMLVLLAIATIALRGNIPASAAAIGTFMLLFLASRGRLNWLAWKPLVFFGVISYPLYLVHEKIGWLIVLRLEETLGQPWIAIAAAFVGSVALAVLLHKLVEKPASRKIRHVYRSGNSSGRPYNVKVWLAGTASSLLILAVASVVTAKSEKTGRTPRFTLALNQPALQKMHACDDGLDKQLLVILGQSNAASSAQRSADNPAINVFFAGRCLLTSDPLPNTTGIDASIWTALVPRLPKSNEIVVAPLAVGNTKIFDWLEPGELQRKFGIFLQEVRRSNIPVAGVLWQQGEADAIAGTAAGEYRDALLALRKTLDEADIHAPLFVATSTYCFGKSSEHLRRAIKAAVASHPRILEGANTDKLLEKYRRDNCHFNTEGRTAAAELWREKLSVLSYP